MGKYSSDSDSSSYSRKKKSRRRRSSSRSSSTSSSRYSSSLKSKKNKKHRRSRSSERSSKHRRRSKDRRSSSRSKKSKKSKHSRRRSRSLNRSPYNSRSLSKNRSPSYSKSRRSRSNSPSSRPNDKRSPLFDGAELLAKLNKAATEAMAENSKRLESLYPGIPRTDNPQSRSNAIDEINAPGFVQRTFASAKKEDDPAVVEISGFVNFNTMKEEPGCLLHPNLLIEDQVEKNNRWIRKLYLMRQRAMQEQLCCE